MLKLFCNLLELIRMRDSLILGVSETVLLEDVFEQQKKLLNKQGTKLYFPEQIK